MALEDMLRGTPPNVSAPDTDFTDLEHDYVGSSIEFHAVDDTFDSESTNDDLEGDFNDDELGELVAREAEWFDEDDPEGDFEPSWDSDADPKISDSESRADSGEYPRDNDGLEDD